MKNVRFYVEGERKPHRDDDGNVIAVFANAYSYGRYDALVSVYDWPDSPVAGTTVDLWHLARHCTRISERRARELHPALFERLDKSQ